MSVSKPNKEEIIDRLLATHSKAQKLVITLKDEPGSPRYTARMRWNPSGYGVMTRCPSTMPNVGAIGNPASFR